MDTKELDYFEVDSYDEWLEACKLHNPEGRLNKKGEPGYIVGYGEEDDQEWVVDKVNPDMQADVLGCWSESNQFGWFTSTCLEDLTCPSSLSSPSST